MKAIKCCLYGILNRRRQIKDASIVVGFKAGDRGKSMAKLTRLCSIKEVLLGDQVCYSKGRMNELNDKNKKLMSVECTV